MPTRKEYNGWFNYETWAANLHYDNAFQDDAEQALETALDDKSETDSADDIRNAAVDALAETIESIIEENETANMPQNGLAAEFANAGFREIEYHEIAAHYIDDILRDKPLFSAGFNMPGYMPDNVPAIFHGDSAARDYIADEIERAASEIEQDETAETTEEEIEQTEAIASAAERCRNGKGEFGETIGKFHYFVTKL